MQAVSSRRVRYQKQLEEIMELHAAPGAPALPFARLWPNLQFVDGPIPVLDEEAKRWYIEHTNVEPDMIGYVKHMLKLHDGEARIVGDIEWNLLPAPWRGNSNAPRGVDGVPPELLALPARAEPGDPGVAVAAQSRGL